MAAKMSQNVRSRALEQPYKALRLKMLEWPHVSTGTLYSIEGSYIHLYPAGS